jgi:type I restriction enzyme S subunit
MPLPPLSEQRIIACALSDMDALIRAQDQLIAKKRNLKQAAMQQILTGKQRLPGFHGEWEVKRLGDSAEVVMGQSPAGTSYNRSGFGSPLINGPTEFTDKHPIKIQWTSQPTKFCKKGDLLLCVRGSSTGRINISDDEYCIGRGVAAIRAKTEADTSFVTSQIGSATEVMLLRQGELLLDCSGK